MSVLAKLGAYLAGLALVFAAAFGVGDALGSADGPSEEQRPPSTSAPHGPEGHQEGGS